MPRFSRFGGIFHELNLLACGIDVPQVSFVINYVLEVQEKGCCYQFCDLGR
ncbi:hypothetical protein LguiB_001655 [Lonicera macranthoides]